MRGTAIFLCNLTMNMAQPWADAGYRVVLVDPQHMVDSVNGSIERIASTVIDAADRIGTILRYEHVVFVAGFPPCTDVAVSGSRWFEAKRIDDPHFQSKAALVAEQCRMIGMLSGAPWMFENPVSVFSSIFGRAQHSFHPYHFTGLCLDDNYTKQTCLWSGGGFVMPTPKIHENVKRAISIVEGSFGRLVPKKKALERFSDNQIVVAFYPDNRIHDAPPGEERANFRSATPRGFSEATFLVNSPHLKQRYLERVA